MESRRRIGFDWIIQYQIRRGNMKKWLYAVIAIVIGVVGWAAYNIYKHSYDPELQKQKESIKGFLWIPRRKRFKNIAKSINGN